MKLFSFILCLCIYTSLDLYAQGRKTNQLQEPTAFKVLEFKFLYSSDNTHYTNFIIKKDSTFFETYTNDYKIIVYKKVALATQKGEWESLNSKFNFSNFETVEKTKALATHLVGIYKETFVANTNYGNKQIENTQYIQHNFSGLKPFIQNLRQLVENYQNKYPAEVIKKVD